MRTFVIGDIHGADLALRQVLFRSSFDFENDKLIVLGDICDGWSGIKECIEILMKVKNLVLLKGNHDAWYLQFLDQNIMIQETNKKFGRDLTLDSVNAYNDEYFAWLTQGGEATVKSLGMDETIYSSFLRKGKLIHIDGQNNFFAHAGGWLSGDLEDLDYLYDYFPMHRPNLENRFIWDRANIYWQIGDPNHVSLYNKIYVGHTPVLSVAGYYNRKEPLELANVIMMDTGAAFTGTLSMQNIDTGENFISDVVMTLYPDEKGRNKKTFNQLTNGTTN